MNKTQEHFRTLEEKLINVGIPAEIAKKYVMCQKICADRNSASESYELPSDDNFKTLSKMYEIYCKQHNDQPIGELTIENFLLTPYSQVEATRGIISELFKNRPDDIAALYENEIHIYGLRPDEATYIYDIIAEYISDEEKLWKVFKKAAVVGEFYTSSRIEALIDAVGGKYASEVIYESVVNGFLFHPYYIDPIEALKYLKTQFHEETIARIIIENPFYLYLYKDKYYVEFPDSKKIREAEISKIIEKYK